MFLRRLVFLDSRFIQDMSPNENIIFSKNFRDKTKMF